MNYNRDKNPENVNDENGTDNEILFHLSKENPEIINKVVELKTLKDLIQTNYLQLEKKRQKLREEEHNLHLLQKEIWAIQDAICNDVWNFSHDHDFARVIREMPNVSKESLRNYSASKYESHRKEIVSKALQHPAVFDLTIQVEELEKQVENTSLEDALKQEIEEVSLELATQDDEPNILFLKKELEHAQRDLEILNQKIEQAKLEVRLKAPEIPPAEPSIVCQSSFNDVNMELFIENYAKQPQTAISPPNCIPKTLNESRALEDKISESKTTESEVNPKSVLNESIRPLPNIPEKRGAMFKPKVPLTNIYKKRPAEVTHPNVHPASNNRDLSVSEILETENLNEFFAEDFPVPNDFNVIQPEFLPAKPILSQSSNSSNSNKCMPPAKKRVKFDLSPYELKSPPRDKPRKQMTRFVVKTQSKISIKLLNRKK